MKDLQSLETSSAWCGDTEPAVRKKRGLHVLADPRQQECVSVYKCETFLQYSYDYQTDDQ